MWRSSDGIGSTGVGSYFESVRSRSLDIDDLEDGGLVWGLLVGAVDANHLTTWLAEVLLFSLLHSQGEQIVRALVRRNLEANDAAGAVKLTDHGEGHGAGQDGHVGSVLGDEAGQMTSVSQHNDQVNVQVLHSGHS